ncbi:hypothetical protein [Kordia sp.]|uniref:hypothetical protein n=1 Tax=Kordia sp. TaxID=1965332 RepID=UPI003D28846C
MKLIVFINIILIGGLLFYKKNGEFMDDMWIFYVTHYVSLFIFVMRFLMKETRNIYMIFSPILFSFLYLGLSFTLGSIFIPLNYGWSKEVYENIIYIDKLNIYTIYFFIVDLILLHYWVKIIRKNKKLIPKRKDVIWPDFIPVIFFSFFVFLILISYVPVFKNLLLGFEYPFKLVLIIYLVLQSFNFSRGLRILLYTILIGIIFSQHYSSKREVILVVFIFMFLESVKSGFEIKVKFKFILMMLSVAFLGVYLIFAASIMRGYGGYQLDSKLDAFLKVPDYVSQPYFKHIFVENFEVNTVLGNTMICMDFVEKEKLPLQYGGTYVKIFLTPIPRSIWKNKPEGMILKYTYTLNPEHKKNGQSLPVVHYAEGFANFYWFGMIAVVFILVSFEKIFWYVIKQRKIKILNGKLIFSIYIVCILFQYIRGSGFDLFMLYTLAPLPLILIISLMPKKQKNVSD